MTVLNQEEQVLKLLRKAGKRGVENYTFSNNRVLRYGATINRLRAEGHNILTERVKLANGRSTGVYRYTLLEDLKPNPWTKNIFHRVKEIE